MSVLAQDKEFIGTSAEKSPDRVISAPSDWLKASLDSNTLAPQMNLSIVTHLGNQIARDIADGKATWEDAVFAYLDREQIEHVKDQVAILHAAHRESPHMPEGHPHPHSVPGNTIPDTDFQLLWRGEMKSAVSVFLKMSEWAESAEKTSLPPFDYPEDSETDLSMDPRIATRLHTFFTDKRYRPYVRTMLQLFHVAIATLDSPQGKILQKQKRDENNDRKKHPDFETDAEQSMLVLLENALESETEKLRSEGSEIQLPTNLARVFKEAIDNQIPEDFEYAEEKSETSQSS